jgi:hypothetical protein
VFVICLFGLSNEHENVSQDIDNIPMDSALITVVTDDVTINISKQSEECYKVSYYTSISFFNRKSSVIF